MATMDEGKDSIKEFVKVAHATALEKGFWSESQNIGEKLMLIVTEVAEALESDRKSRYAKNSGYLEDLLAEQGNMRGFSVAAFEKNIKDTFEDEMADIAIRLFDLCGFKGIDLEYHIRMKMDYNATRGHLHGKKY